LYNYIENNLTVTKEVLKMAVNKYGVDIDDLRQEMKDIERRSARGPYWTPQVGKNVVRVLPASAEGKPFYHKVWGHWVRSKSTSFPCLSKMKGEKCALCEEVDRLREAGDRKKASGLNASARYYLQLVDRKAPENGVQIFNTGATVFKGIVALLDDEDWGPGLLDIKTGYDIVIERVGEGLDTTYPSIRARKDPSPSEISIEALLNLEDIIDYYTYDEMHAVVAGEATSSAPAEAPPIEASSDTESNEKSPPAKKGKPECYKKYNPDDEKCKACEYNFDCEIDTPAS